MIYILRADTQRNACIKHINTLILCDKSAYSVNISLYKPRRNNEQNALLWRIYNEIAQAFGCSSDTVHEYCKRQFLGYTETQIGGEVVKIGNSTARLSTKEFGEYVEEVTAWAVCDLGISL